MNIIIQAQEIARITEQLAAMCGDDDRLFSDSVEGETDLYRLVASLHNGIATDQELVTGIKERQSDLSARKSRLDARIAARRAAIASLMQAGQQSKIELPEATFSLRDGKPSLAVVDPAAVPEEYQRLTVSPNKDAINDAFAGVDDLPNWLTVNEAKAVLSIRSK